MSSLLKEPCLLAELPFYSYEFDLDTTSDENVFVTRFSRRRAKFNEYVHQHIESQLREKIPNLTWDLAQEMDKVKYYEREFPYLVWEADTAKESNVELRRAMRGMGKRLKKTEKRSRQENVTRCVSTQASLSASTKNAGCQTDISFLNDHWVQERAREMRIWRQKNAVIIF